MIQILERQRRTCMYKLLSCLLIICFSASMIVPPSVYAQGFLPLPAPGLMVPLSPGFSPLVIRGLKLYSDEPLRFDFIIDTGETKLKDKALEEEASKLIKYFLASLTVPEEDLWVNLSPYEKDKIIPNQFGVTEMGRDMLAQDYLLKQLTASLIYPEDELGKKNSGNAFTNKLKNNSKQQILRLIHSIKFGCFREKQLSTKVGIRPLWSIVN